ncbi:hypothetical protein EXIGLDRAFT_762615 [Exidia glandulosa HHB12029]|uniref:Uncharacterized protein n=1 Tax=Exidia glandulosa HHB12029 TaxID=1314781 RepID=A0A165MNE5_EXIGL|nr:hypothetical protein EXIGLDRAFT_762615 [Exidia glandulosa HHB12029]
MADDPRWVGRSLDFVDTNDLADECITNSPARVMVLDSSTDGPRLSFTAAHITVYGGFETWPRTSESISTDAIASWIIDHDSTVKTNSKFRQRDRIDINLTDSEPVCDTVLFQTSLPDPGHHHLDVTLTPLAEKDNVILYIYNVTLSGANDQSVTSSPSSSATVHGTSTTTKFSRGTSTTAAQSTASPIVTSSSSAATDPRGAGPLIRQTHSTRTGSVKWYAVVPSILAVLVGLAALVIFRRRRRRQCSKQAADLNPYNDASRDDAHDVDAATREVKMQHWEMKERDSVHPFTLPGLPRGPRDEATKESQLRQGSAEVSGSDGEVEETADALVEAVQEAGFSVAALMKSLRRVRHRGDRESDLVAPPTYDGLDSTG